MALKELGEKYGNQDGIAESAISSKKANTW
jgi:hypothetical protein